MPSFLRIGLCFSLSAPQISQRLDDCWIDGDFTNQSARKKTVPLRNRHWYSFLLFSYRFFGSETILVLLQFADFNVAEFNRIAVAGESEEATGAIFARMWCVGHQFRHFGKIGIQNLVAV